MNYVVFKNVVRKQYRIYTDVSDYEGNIIYKGHKLGLELNSLSQLIDYRIEKTSNRVSVLMYDKIKENVSVLDASIWKIGSSENLGKLILESWESVQIALESKCGKFRKILITEVNI